MLKIYQSLLKNSSQMIFKLAHKTTDKCHEFPFLVLDQDLGILKAIDS